MLNSTGYEVYHAYNCQNAFNIYQHDKYNFWEFESKKKSLFLRISIFYEQLKFHAQLSWAWKSFYIPGPWWFILEIYFCRNWTLSFEKWLEV